MDKKHTTGAEQASSPGEPFSEDRRVVALEATWEIEQLTNAIRELCDDMLPRDDVCMPIRLRVRGLTARIEDLIGVTMSVLDDDDKVEDLARRVYGRSRRAAPVGDAAEPVVPGARA